MKTTIITCPYCGTRNTVEIPKDQIVDKHRCERCKREIHPRKDEHCVICSYGVSKCK